MNRTEKRRPRRWPRAAVVALALGVIVAGSSCDHRSNGSGSGSSSESLVQDPMADVQVANAKRLTRDVQKLKFGNGLEKDKFPEVMQTFEASGEGAAALAVRDSLVQLAREAGWTITKTEPGQHGVVVGEKKIGESNARLTVDVSPYQKNKIVLFLS